MPWLKRLSRRGRSLIWVSVCGKHEEDIVLPWMMHIERYICHNRCICCSYAPYAWGKTTICLNFYSYESVVFPCHSDHFAVWLNRYNACSSEYLQGCWSYAINSTKVKRILPLWLPKYKHWPCALHVRTWRGLRSWYTVIFPEFIVVWGSGCQNLAQESCKASPRVLFKISNHRWIWDMSAGPCLNERCLSSRWDGAW